MASRRIDSKKFLSLKQWFIQHGQNQSRAIKKIPISPSYIHPGDVLLLSYPEDYELRLVLVVSNKSGNGIYTSTSGNVLLSTFKLSDSKLINKLVLENFYTKGSYASYENFRPVLESLFGLMAYRTYNLSKIRELYKVYLDTSKIEIDTE